jgi:hypothetical protein
LSPDELEKLRQFVAELIQSFAPPCQALEFVFPGNINPDTWKAIAQAHCYGWHWISGHAYRQDKPPAPSKPTPMKRYFSSLMKVFPEQAQRLQQVITASEAPHPDLAQRLTKMPSFEKLFRDRRWVSPTEAFLGTGGLAVFCVEDPDRFFREAAAASGQAGSMASQGMSFVIPLFTKESFMSASRETLRRWFDLFHIYLVEYRYSEGLLIASRHDLSEKVRPFQFQLSQSEHGPNEERLSDA